MSLGGITVLYPAARWLGYLAAFLVVGSVGFQQWVLPRAAGSEPEAAAPLARRANRLAAVAGFVLVGAHLLRLYCQARSLLDPEPITLSFIGAAFTTGWGRGWLGQTAAALAAAIGGLAGRSPLGRLLLGVGASAIILTAPLTGHAIALPQAGRIGYPLDLFHFGFGALWLGTLAVMLLVGLTGHRAGTIPPRRLVAAFSPLALRTGLGAIALGLVIAWRYLGGLAPFVTSTYGRTVLLKILALGGVAAVGAYNWRVVGPRLDRGDDAPVRRSAALEVAIGIVLIGVTAVLVALPLPGEE